MTEPAGERRLREIASKIENNWLDGDDGVMETAVAVLRSELKGLLGLAKTSTVRLSICAGRMRGLNAEQHERNQQPVHELIGEVEDWIEEQDEELSKWK